MNQLQTKSMAIFVPIAIHTEKNEDHIMDKSKNYLFFPVLDFPSCKSFHPMKHH